MNSLDIIRPFAERIRDRHDVQVIGGLGAFALARPDVMINREYKEVQLPRGAELPQRRENGTIRDIDILVVSADEAVVDAVGAVAEDTMGEHLEVSMFGIHAHKKHAHTPLSIQVTSDRYETEDGSVVRNLSPFSVPIPRESLEPWHLVSGDVRYPISSPLSVITNYATRSIGGLRSKDVPKITQVVTNLEQTYPNFADELMSGQYRPQVELAVLLSSLRGARPHPVLPFAHEQYSYDEILQHDAFVLRDSSASEIHKRAVIAAAAFRAFVMHGVESQQKIVDTWQRLGIERALAARFVKNK